MREGAGRPARGVRSLLYPQIPAKPPLLAFISHQFFTNTLDVIAPAKPKQNQPAMSWCASLSRSFRWSSLDVRVGVRNHRCLLWEACYTPELWLWCAPRLLIVYCFIECFVDHEDGAMYRSCLREIVVFLFRLCLSCLFSWLIMSLPPYSFLDAKGCRATPGCVSRGIPSRRSHCTTTVRFMPEWMVQ